MVETDLSSKTVNHSSPSFSAVTVLYEKQRILLEMNR